MAVRSHQSPTLTRFPEVSQRRTRTAAWCLASQPVDVAPIAQCGTRTPRLRCDSNRSNRIEDAPPLRGASKGNWPKRLVSAPVGRRRGFAAGIASAAAACLAVRRSPAQSRQATQHGAVAQQDDVLQRGNATAGRCASVPCNSRIPSFAVNAGKACRCNSLSTSEADAPLVAHEVPALHAKQVLLPACMRDLCR